MPRVLLIVALVALSVYALVEALQADPRRVRLMPRWLWALAVLVPALGPLGWFTLGRPTQHGVGGGTRRAIAPDDDPDFLRGL
ncbi:MAG: PLDc N-terminal domain-containing protein [Propionibacteriaceae bacterium]|nr:PLDc N-terminal domain-containing protein [Propionibacteriaceae bacterium]